MRIGIIGAGNIGATLAYKFVSAGHDVKLAASKGPDAIREIARRAGATAVSVEDVVSEVDAVIVAIPTARIPELGAVFAGVPPEVIVMDTTNYYPFRDGPIAELDGGMAESVWVSEHVGRPVIKVFNAVLAHTLAQKGNTRGAPGRIAIPVAGDDKRGKEIAAKLVQDAGFDAVDAGNLAESWRQQPGTPAYCTELKADHLKTALGMANRTAAAENRETLIKKFVAGAAATHEEVVALNREGTAPR
jgi:8-hydroxy-5-deazaflavin:NADPH oxidoreductase